MVQTKSRYCCCCVLYVDLEPNQRPSFLLALERYLPRRRPPRREEELRLTSRTSL